MAAIAIHVALTHIDFSNDTATFLTDKQDLNNLEELTLLDDHGVETLCKICRHPGGQVLHAPAAIAAGGALNIMNLGFRYHGGLRTISSWLATYYATRYAHLGHHKQPR